MRSISWLLVALAILAAACSSPGASGEPPAASGSEPTTTAAPVTPAAPAESPATTIAPATTEPAPDGEPAPQGDAPPVGILYPNYVRTDVVAVSGDPADVIEVDIHAPEEIGPWPVVVTVFGGAWITGDRESMAPLADGLARRKVVAFNASYDTMALGGRFPDMVDDVACAVQHARISAAEFTTTPEQVTVVAHSAGAHLASLVALAPSEFGRACSDGPMQGPDALVGLAGPYDISGLGPLLTGFFGGTPEEAPEAWAAGNPYTWIADAPDLPVLLVHGDRDAVVPIELSDQMEIALIEGGHDVTYEVLFDRGHSEANAPRVVGDLIARFVTELAER